MPSSWGANVSPALPIFLQNSGAVTCPAGVWTTVLAFGGTTTPIAYIIGQNATYAVLITGVLTMTTGATAPTAVQIASAQVAGTPIGAYSLYAAALAAATTYVLPIALAQGGSFIYGNAPGNVVLVQLNPTAQAVTIQATGSAAYATFLPV